MNQQETNRVFERSGLASLSDLRSPRYEEVFALLEDEQDVFLKKESTFRSDLYKWPRDPLHSFSRVWEYPYVYHHLSTRIQEHSVNSKMMVADVGSGLTFFPFSLAKLGCHVVCSDVDRVYEKEIALAGQNVPHSPGSVDFRLVKGSRLPFGDSECDAVYSISVLEHIPDFEETISEISRILKPGGLFLLTCDLLLKDSPGKRLDPGQYAQLRSAIEALFFHVYPERTIHPADVLTTTSSPYPFKVPFLRVIESGGSWMKQKVLKPLIGRKPGLVRRALPRLAVIGLVLRKIS